MKRKLISFISILALVIGILPLNIQIAQAEGLSFNQLREVDKGSFNEYGYKITKSFFKLKETFEVDFVIDSTIANELLSYVEEAYKHLPDDLNNESKYNSARIALKRGLKYPNNDKYFEGIRKSLEDFIEKPNIQQIKGSIRATPNEGNAPLVSTLNAELEDPSGTQISRGSYVWWMNVNGKRTVIGNKPSLSHTFTEEGTYTVFLDVKSSHKNKAGYKDVLPYSSSVKIKVKEKIASIILRISGKSLNFDNEIKFSPDTAGYGLIFDATSSVAASGTKFLTTTWDFGNGVKKSYSGSPRIERIIYSREGEYDAVLKLKTNRGKIIEKQFRVLVHKPIASIKTNATEGFMGDAFKFRAKAYGDTKHLSYSWEVIDTKKDEKIATKVGNIFTYNFKEKGKYSVKLKITDGAGNLDVDTKTIYINSRAPIANFKTSIPYLNKPNKVFFDATSSYDPDYGDDGNLKYSWMIDGEKVNLEESNEDGSNGFYTFSTTGDHSIVLEVEDLDEISSILRGSVKVNSLLDVDFSIYPRVVQREKTVRFIAESSKAKFYEWDFGDGEIKSKADSKITHSYSKSGIYSVKLTTRGVNRTKNSYIKNVYVGDSKNPVSVIDITKQGAFDFRKEEKACSGKTAYIINRKDNIILSGKESIDTNGKSSGLSYSWIVGQGKYKTGQSINERFDELGCYRIKLTVKSERDKTTNASEIWVKVKNIKPTISGLKIAPIDLNTDPVIVNVSALGTKDKDGVIQSYLWYYTTDIDNEAQDFRITKTANTTFVIPKIQGTYYFGVMMKDNNGAKVNSEDLVNKIGNNFVELQGDNSNTPLIDFTVGDSSVAIGDEVNFRAVAKNIRGDSIEKSAKFSWDFDGDGFYEKETDKGTITYKYKKSGTFYPKVKVRNKGFSNTRTLTVSVSNKLVGDFKYISVGNKYIFVDTSKGTIDKNSWDLGDGTKEEDKEKLIHNYKDKKSVHSVELTVAEGTKVKKITKEVEKDLRNLIKTRKKGLNIFSFPALNDEGIITLEEEESVFMYMGESKGDFKFYGIDYDIDKDTDVNGGADDDIDNKNNSSYKTGSPDEILLNNNREQTIRLFLLDEDLETIDSKDIKIVKNYIEEVEEVKIGKFNGVTDSEKAKIEELKIAIKKLPQQHRMKSMQYVQKLQENWSDETEKVRTIISFEQFLDTTGEKNVDKIINLLESLISETPEATEIDTYFNALKALIPNDIQCSVETGTCKEYLVTKLEEIRDSNDIDSNRIVAKEFIAIGKDKSMTKKQKEDFRGILQQLIYKGTPDNNGNTNIPGVDNPGTSGNGTGTIDEPEEPGELGSFLKNAGWWIAGIVGVIIFLMFVFWIIDFLKNRKSGESFEDFVDNKNPEEEDILGDFSEKSVDPLMESNVEEKPSAIFTPEVKEEEVKVEKKEEPKDNPSPSGLPLEKEDNKKEDIEEDIPDWLSGNVDEEPKNNPSPSGLPLEKEDKKEEIKTEEDELGFSLDIPEEEKTIEEKKENKEDSPIIPFHKGDEDKDKDKKEEKTETKSEDDELDFDIEKETSIDLEEKDNTPDWLKDSLTEKLPEKEKIEEPKNNPSSSGLPLEKEDKKEEPEPVIIEDKAEEKLKLDTEEDIPDWLKGSLDESKKEEKKEKEKSKNPSPSGLPLEKEDKKEESQMGDKVKLDDEDVPDWLKGSLDETKKEKTDTEKPKKEKKSSKKKIDKPKKDKQGASAPGNKKSDKKDDELWDDGMTVPDWLKSE